ncbi:MAG TPA: FeoA family protein [Defluviitaleaceae bacterium]|jgi:ferrous iron transport protein A|nr:FeoA family protein [Defluviitaleaceae bacterium]HPT75636.1 FeoA family protein [Defluviitaleaceae bacterium]HQD51160.1 FeoA family protein [Defluviitaleaceae bacterium]
MPLTFAKIGERKTIKKISGKDSIKRFLESLGFVEGTEVTVLSDIHGNLIVNVKESRIALSKEMACKIVV